MIHSHSSVSALAGSLKDRSRSASAAELAGIPWLHALTPADRERLGILLISMDPARDNAAALTSVARKRKLDPTRWTLARTEPASVRRIAALLGVRYRELADGEFNHSSALVLLDANPLESLATLRKPQAVIVGGRLLDRAALDEMESDLLADGE